MLKQEQATEYCQKTFAIMVEAIQDSEDQEGLAESMSVVLGHVLGTYGALTFPDKNLNKEFVRQVAGAFKDKVEDLAERESVKKEGEQDKAA